jgi:hypothetical protein
MTMPSLDASQEAAIAEFVEELTTRIPLSRATMEERRNAFDQQTRESIKSLGSDVFLSEAKSKLEFTDLAEWDAFWTSIQDDPVALIQRAKTDLESMRDTGWGPHCTAARRLAQLLDRCGRTDLERSFLNAWLAAAPNGDSTAYSKLVKRAARLNES